MPVIPTVLSNDKSLSIPTRSLPRPSVNSCEKKMGGVFNRRREKGNSDEPRKETPTTVVGSLRVEMCVCPGGSSSSFLKMFLSSTGADAQNLLHLFSVGRSCGGDSVSGEIYTALGCSSLTRRSIDTTSPAHQCHTRHPEGALVSDLIYFLPVVYYIHTDT